jgi:hypothetical protein
MSKHFADHYTFEVPTADRYQEIQDFYGSVWNQNHILVRNSSVFFYEFLNRKHQLNFVVARSKSTGRVEASTGFIEYGRGNPNQTVCGVMTAAVKNTKVPFVGLETNRLVKITVNAKYYAGIGTNPETMLPLVKKVLRRKTGIMSHYFRPNTNIQPSDYRVIKTRNYLLGAPRGDILQPRNSLTIQRVDSITDSIIQDCSLHTGRKTPYKSVEYLQKRYFLHPYYKYDVWVPSLKGKLINILLITRKVFNGDRALLRLVDLVGDLDSLESIDVSHALDSLMDAHTEAVDFFISSTSSGVPEKLGLRLKSTEDEIVPTLFEPFYQKNVKTYFETDSEYLFFKADGDFDRVNLVRS